MNKRSKGIFTYFFIFLLAGFCIYFLGTRLSGNVDRTDYTTVIKYFDDYQVSYYELDLGSGELKYRLRGDERLYTYSVPNVQIFYEDTQNYRQEYNEKYPEEPLRQDYIKITDHTWLYSLIPVLLTIILGVAIIFFMMKQNSGGGKYTSFGKANLKSAASARKATFADVAGADEEKQELQAQGIKVNNVEVYSGLSQDFFAGSQAGQQGLYQQGDGDCKAGGVGPQQYRDEGTSDSVAGGASG